MIRVAVILDNKIVRISIVKDIETLAVTLTESHEVFEIKNKKYKVGDSWSMFPTVRKINKYFKKKKGEIK